MSLARFTAAARKRVAAGAYGLAGPRCAPHGSLLAALRRHPAPVIAEVKPRSPSEGPLLRRPVRDLLEDYRSGGAAAVSVLTDADHFGGSPALLREAHGAGLPTLMKDFVVDARQLACARHHGASAVLLIERLFSDPAEREALVAGAHGLGLEVLLEVHDAEEWARARESRADLLGVNARDLETLRSNVASALDLVGRIARERPVVALSAIHGRDGHQEARRSGALAVLVGTHLLRSADARLALRALQRPLAKVCGLRTPDEVEAAGRAGADLVGFVVGSPGSPRDVAPAAAEALVREARRRGVRSVLVTRHPDPVQVQAWCQAVRPDYVQVHGFAPDAAWCRRLADVPAWVLAAGPGVRASEGVAGLVRDSGDGGSGRAHDWAADRAAAADGLLTLVAGGLGPQNAREALQASGAWGADASGGLESAPGVKDAARVAAFVREVHSA